MSKSTKIEFSDDQGYENKIEIVVKLKMSVDSADYKTIVDAAEKIMETAGKYLVRETDEEGTE